MRKLVLPLEYIQKNKVLVEGDIVYITQETPFYIVEDIRFLTGKFIKPVVISEEDFQHKLEEYISSLTSSIEEQEELDEEKHLENLLKAESSPILQTLNTTILKAIKVKASDIHFEPFQNKVVVRYRLDGVLYEETTIPKTAYPQIVSRIKVMAKLNVAEKRLPQDGRIKVKVGEREIDLRISTLPTVFGERIVIRILDKTNKVFTLEELGFLDDTLSKFENLIKKPYGLILLTGPTGSGKSTTLYASLLKLKSPKKNIITIEDPVEYQIEGISQIQVNPKINLTFANGLRSILRQDPDVIMVGEIRDKETAEIVIHASMTGHLVLSTLHTNDAPSSVARLIDMGVEPFLVSSSLEGVVAQRLVRKICENCKTKVKPTEFQKETISKFIGKQVDTLYKGVGCENCLNTGYKGRVAIHEIFIIDEEIKALIAKNTPISKIKQLAIKNGMKTLLQDGLLKAVFGITTVEEVLQTAVG